MTYDGTVQNGVIVLAGGQSLPEGTPVSVVALPVAPESSIMEQNDSIWEKLAKLAREVESMPCDLPADLAANHDHYLYGTPKRQ